MDKAETNTYCLGRIPGGYAITMRCNQRIPVKEVLCGDCKKRSEEVKKPVAR